MDLLSLVSNSDQKLDQIFFEELVVPIKDDGICYPKMDPHS
jgi:hypothetical protein